MREIGESPKKTLFVCGRQREGKPSCGGQGSVELVGVLKKWIKDNDLGDRFACRKSSCLGHCSDGIVACIYPANRWLTNVSAADTAALQTILLED